VKVNRTEAIAIQPLEGEVVNGPNQG